MTEKQHKIYFLAVLISCILLMLTLNPSKRNSIVLVWGIFGFGVHGYLTMKAWLDLCKKLVFGHKKDLQEMKIGYHHNQFKITIDLFGLLQNRQKIEGLSNEIKSKFSLFYTYFRLTLIAFIMFAALGILAVIMTW